MRFVTDCQYGGEYRLRLRFDDGATKIVDLKDHLDGRVFAPLKKDMAMFRAARLNADLDTVVWPNGADMSPDFLYEIGVSLETDTALRVAESGASYGEAEGKRKTSGS